jgi:hypothetical protein
MGTKLRSSITFRAALAGFAIAAAAGCATGSFRNVHVTSASAAQFYYLSTPAFLSLGGTDAERRRAVENAPYYGPHSVGGPVPYEEGVQHIFIPRCNGRHSWANEYRTTPYRGGPSVPITCR